MNHIKTFLFFLLGAISFAGVQAQGIEFFHGTWEEALAKAFEEEKVIFVDAYTTWCGPCKRMAATTFKDASVGEYFNQNFVNVKLDMEKSEGLRWRDKYPVTAYPTLYWIDGDGSVVTKSVGGKQVAGLMKIAKKANKNIDRSAKYAVDYEAGKRDFDIVYNYVRTLNKAKKPSLKISNDYMKSNPDITSDQRRQFLLEAVTSVDSKIFEKMVAEKSAIEKQLGKEVVAEKVLTAAQNTVQKAMDYEAPSLMDEAFAAVKAHLPKKYDEFKASSTMEFALFMRDVDAYKKEAKNYVKKIVGDDPVALHKFANEIKSYFDDDRDLMKMAEDASGKAFELQNIYQHLELHITILMENGKVDDAIKLVDARIEKAEKESNTKGLNQLKKLKRKISNS